ncbi:SDR family NAD(P)-dependent oxidoreductase [Clostridium beijerinckii]|uniref:Acyl transferase domain-containing protein/2-polyprenyl-3-methyl-5-hydroxy-6-metoxy-1, 4-benzoquinol methylase n=1 Tax=Clostridium beijerinckii TaxID=1520 RepID=A0AAE5H3X1_CLOBE|nr:SDR family NAD(P)-dependent oxidoreductase [Clostridium beijerinckii]NSB14158.1 acyl transferase domain-containing protein/2-polyprenyl-3-methyl-5-hydroxy-6-metoxy-1,4-benzoquinol methylase [Clostridium beijerinckii]OOM30510.1 polyketide synthase PksM [Clostridium beijerinckii]
MELNQILNALKKREISIEDAKDKLNKKVSQPNIYQDKPHDSDNKNYKEEKFYNIDSSKSESVYNDNDIAIVGISGRYPGSEDMISYWDNLSQGKNLIKEIPKERWDVDKYYNADDTKEINCKWMGYIDSIGDFDPSFFYISEKESASMDPQQRIFLEEGYKAFEDAGYNSNNLNNKKCGIYLGYTGSEYGNILSKKNSDYITITNNNSAIAAARIAYYLNLKGPAISIDTACSSSLVATHLAYEALINNEIEMALVGGVSLYIGPDRIITMCKEHMLSKSGVCKSFDNDADGFVPGEGVGALVLKRLKDAEKDHDNIYGVIAASGINQNGSTNGITAPSKASQIELEEQIYNKYRINPENITYAEMHGTATKMGDFIELEALSSVFCKKTNKKEYCAIGSVKSNIGHTSAVSGIASIQKVLLCMKNEKLVPTLNVKNKNSFFNFEQSPFYINTELKDWKIDNDSIRTSSVSSFGFSGCNAHLVLKEYIPEKPEFKEQTLNKSVIFVLSAKEQSQLYVYAESMKNFIDNNDIDLNNMAYTLQLGRDAMNYRIAFIVSSKMELSNALSNFIRNKYIEEKNDSQFCGCMNSEYEIDNNTIEVYIKENNLKMLADAWVKGVNIDWDKLYLDSKPYKISLPVYPFLNKNYWIGEINDNELEEVTEKIIESNYTVEKYNTNEPYFKEHKVNQVPVLIGMTHASLAINKFFDMYKDENSVLLSKLNFIEQVKLEKNEEVEIRIEPTQKDSKIDFKALYKFESEKEWRLTATGTLKKNVFQNQKKDIQELKNSMNVFNDFEKIYDINPAVQIGSIFRPITEFYIGKNKALSKVILNDELKKNDHNYILHPIVIYCAFQVVASLIGESNLKDGFLPFGISDITVKKDCNLDEFWIYVDLKKYSGELAVFDAQVIDNYGNVVAGFSRCFSKRLRPEKSSLNNMSLNLEKDSNISSSYIKSEISDINKSIEKYLINKLKPIMPNKNTVSTKVNLMDLGLESAQLVKLSEEIENDINIELTPAIFFEYPNIKLLTEFFVDEYKEAFIKALNINQNNNLEEEASFDIDNTKEYKYTDDILEDKKVDYSINEDIAIIGMSGIMPDGMDLEGFWQKIRRGENLIKEIPSDHWDYTKWYDPDMDSEGKTYCKWGSFIEDVDKFDPEFFNISPAEAEWIDPQLRLLLENIYSTGEDSGYINKLKGSNTGMFIGVCCHDYKDLINESYDNINPYVELGNSQTVLANRISFLFDINGPSMAIDTACSSSLVALHNACTAIKNKECDMAFVAGANLLLSPYHYRYFSSIKALSKTGLCHAFDEAADGYVPGEFIGSILLKPLKQAIKDNDHIHAVIKGSASLHGGYTPSFTAPSVEGEENVIVKAWENANIDPNTISYIEAHGTGTKLGDPIEINGLKKAFKRYSDKEHFCAIGSAKVNIGHTEGAAGIAGILKVIMQMKHNEIPPLPVTKGLNKYIKLNKSPLYINREVEEWTTQGDVPRRAGISSFGISGSYAHVVLEEYVNNSNINESEIEEGPVILVLSALNKERLKESAARLLKFICNDKSIALTNMAYTLQVGRKPMEERMGIIASSKDEIKESLKAFIEKDEILENVYYGNSNYKEMALDLIEDDDITKMVDSWISKRKYKNILKSWVNGINIDWLKLYSDKKPSIISLPSYPFAKQRCWIEERNRENSDIKIKECNKMINPLLHDNISNLYEMKFSILFTGNEFFLEDHKVNSNKILPGVSYIEMARAAIYEAMKPVMNDKMGIDFTNINWISPIMVNDKPIKTNIEIYAEDDDNLAYEIYTDDVLNSQGNAKLILIDEIQYLDLNQLKEVCIEHGLSKEKHYEVFANMGIEYGNSYKCVEKSYVGENKVLSKILLPESIIDTEQSYVLHPSVMDAALQTTINLIVDSQKLDEPMLPFAVDEVIVIDKCEKEMWAYTKQCYKEGNNEKVNKFDIDLFNNEGKVCVKIKGISSRKLEKQDKKTLNHLEESNTDFHEAEAKTTMMYPVWDVTSIEYYNKVDLKSNEKNVIVIGGNEKDKGYIQEVYPNSYYLNIESNDTINDIREKLQLCNSIDKVIWILPYKEIESMTDEYLIEGQEEGILPIFRTVKALISLEYDREDLDLTIITTQVQSINQYEKVNPAHSSVYGLVSSLAKEYSNWNIKIIDLESKCKWPISDMLRIPPDKKGDMWVYRKNQWYRQKLITIEDFKVEESKYKENGVYVVIGGAGGIGEAFSEYVIKKYNAQVVWIGRRPIDENIQNKIDKLMKIGPKPYYIRADASNKDAMIKAYERIKEKFLNINGVIHAAIDLLDKSITNMNEDRLRAGLIAKINASVRIAQVFGNENLDFIMFFSSVISFIKGAGQSNYAAGCIFKDNFAHQLSLKLPNKVKIVNWGYFGKVGVVSSKEYQQRMLRIGVGSIEIPEAMETLEKLLSSPIDQIAFVKTINQQESDERKNEEKIIFDNSNEKISLLANENKLNDSLDVNTSLAILNEEKEVYDVSYRLLLSQIEPYFEPGNKGKIIKLYNRWFEESIRTLKENDYIRDSEGSYVLNYPHKDIEKLWEEWNEKKEKWLNNINLKAKVILLEKMLKSLSQIITGKIKSTDIMFPNSSMELLTGVYRDNEIADYVNEVLADKIVEYIEKRISNDPDAKIKILEIGAGTGGTSSIVLKRINQYEKNIKEYCYTDVSRAFLIYGENKFKEENPYLNFKIFNVEEPVSNQNIKEKEYDLVIAANVLHATKNIHYTLRNIKMIMKNNGMIMLNEIINNSLFAHLTFGLLEGWWIYEDSQIRLPGCPGLSFEFWKKSFEDEGFKNVFSVIPSCFKLDQQVIVALSNGVIRKETVLNERIISVNNELKKEMNLEKSNTMINKTNVNINRLISNELLKEKTIEYLKTTISNILKVAAEKINPSSYFNDYGIDSILIIQLTNVLRKKFKKITSTVFFEYETIDSLSDYLIDNNKEELISALNFEDTQSVKSINTPKAENYNESREFKTVPIKLDGTGNLFRRRNKRFKSSSENKAVEVKRKDEVNIAIIGVSGRYPNAENVSEFWDNLKKGKNCITTIPEERWNWKTYFSEKRGQEGKMYSRWGGFIKDIDKFDPLFFKISPAEAEKMDPQERVFLETAYESIEDSGYTPSTLSSNKKVGIFVGVMNGNYATGSKYWSIANRVSYTLDFQGPSLAVDTACSSSLTAVHLAVESLKNGTSECAIAGGVNLIVDPVHYMRLSSMSMISSSDKCKSFGNGADGFVDGEGVGAIVLKPLDKAIESGDNIYGIIKGSMINSGGKTSGYTVPNPKAQSILVLEALKNSGVNVRNITYVEAHGTGTVLGDPIEIAGLTNAFSKDTDCKQFCSIGSVKSNIGHLESAAGIAGITKIILQLKEGKIAASINSEEINPNINFEETPFILQRELSEWKRPIIDENGISKEYPRTAIISSFGAGGANANIVIEEYMSKDSEEKDLEAAYKEIVILSAKYDDRLKKKAKQLLKFIEDNKLSDKDLRKIVYTLQVGREAMDERLGLIVVSIKDLREKLLDFIEDKESLNGIYRDSIKNNRDFVKSFNIDDNFNNNTNQWIRNKQYENILELWVKGIKFDWNKLYEDKKPKRISLPTYPFKKESYWLNESVEDRSKKDSTKVMTKDTNNENCEVIFQEPFWKEEKIIREHAIYGYHVVMLDEDLARYEADIRNSTNASECIILKNNYEGIYNSFTNCFMEIFNKLKSMLKSKLKEKTLVQIVIPFSTEKNILTAITGLLKTAKLENPLLIAQIIQVDKNLKDIGNIINENVYSSSVQIKYVNEKRFVKFLKK